MGESWQARALSHFTLAVRNLERSIAFYELVGFQVVDDRRDAIWPSFVAENFGMKVAQARGALLTVDPGDLHTRLDLLEWLEPCLAESGVPIEERVPQLIGLLTHNVRAAYDDLSARGLEFIVLREDEQHRAVGIKGVAMCRDPDGNLVEFIEYLPGLRHSQPNTVYPKREGAERESALK
jgi:catechol 2,3-dioxygenase-like lactoylglutathione lyase family enzyme